MRILNPYRLAFTRLPADWHGGGYKHTSLRSDVSDQYLSLYREVHNKGGKVTSSGGVRKLSSTAKFGRIQKSLHYIGRAFDLYVYSGGWRPGDDAYVLQLDPHTRLWTVWARSYNGTQEEKELTIKTFKRKKDGKIELRDSVIRGRFFNFTELAKSHGFTPIPAGKSFIKDGYKYANAEWWHFEDRRNLLTFKQELLRTYKIEEIQEHYKYQDVLSERF